MKFIYLVVALTFASFISSEIKSQSISASKINSYLKNQSESYISKELIKTGFVFNKKSNEQNLTEYLYNKNSRDGLEKFNFGYNDELFSIVYKPSKDSYLSLKELMLTTDFVYSYAYKNNKYYVNGKTRIGINDISGIISFFVKRN